MVTPQILSLPSAIVRVSLPLNFQAFSVMTDRKLLRATITALTLCGSADARKRSRVLNAIRCVSFRLLLHERRPIYFPKNLEKNGRNHSKASQN
jgi:hypothetical protein